MNAVPGNKQIEKYEVWKHEIRKCEIWMQFLGKKFTLDLDTSLNIHLNFDIEDIYNLKYLQI